MSMRDRIAQAIRAYHGSPHDFDKFDMSKIGTGEGFQSYGHGLYFAGNEDVARSYRDRLQSTISPHVTYDGQRVNPSLLQSMKGSAEPEEKWLAERYAPLLMSRKQAPLDDIYRDIASATEQRDMWLARKASHEANPPLASTYAPQDYADRAAVAQAQIDKLNAVLPRLDWQKGGGTGKMYEVNINANPEQLLDWDKSMGAQSNTVIDAMRPKIAERLDAMQAARNAMLERGTNAFGKPLPEDRIAKLSAPPPQFEHLTGAEGYRFMGLPAMNQMEGGVRSSQALLDAGVPGIKYLDQGSRVIDAPAPLLAKRLDNEAAIDRISAMPEANRTSADYDLHARLTAENSAIKDQINSFREANQTSNYVVFDPGIIDVMRKYAIPGMATGGMGALAAQDQYGAQP